MTVLLIALTVWVGWGFVAIGLIVGLAWVVRLLGRNPEDELERVWQLPACEPPRTVRR